MRFMAYFLIDLQIYLAATYSMIDYVWLLYITRCLHCTTARVMNHIFRDGSQPVPICIV